MALANKRSRGRPPAFADARCGSCGQRGTLRVIRTYTRYVRFTQASDIERVRVLSCKACGSSHEAVRETLAAPKTFADATFTVRLLGSPGG